MWTLQKTSSCFRTALKIVKVDVDKAEEVSKEITSIPTLVIFKDGEVQEQWSGYTDVNKLKQKLSKYVK